MDGFRDSRWKSSYGVVDLRGCRHVAGYYIYRCDTASRREDTRRDAATGEPGDRTRVCLEHRGRDCRRGGGRVLSDSVARVRGLAEACCRRESESGPVGPGGRSRAATDCGWRDGSANPGCAIRLSADASRSGHLQHRIPCIEQR